MVDFLKITLLVAIFCAPLTVALMIISQQEAANTPHVGEVWKPKRGPDPFIEPPNYRLRVLAVRDGYVQFECYVPREDGTEFRLKESESVEAFTRYNERIQ